MTVLSEHLSIKYVSHTCIHRHTHLWHKDEWYTSVFPSSAHYVVLRGAQLQRGAKLPSRCSVMTIKLLIIIHVMWLHLKEELCNMMEIWRRENMGKCKRELKAGESSFTAEVAVLWLGAWSQHPRLEHRLLTSPRRWECVWTEGRMQYSHSYRYTHKLWGLFSF